MKKRTVMTALLLVITAVSCGGLIGEVRNKKGKEYIIPYSRAAAASNRINEKGEKVEQKYLNERDKSNKIIVYSDLNDEPAKHCRKQRGHSILDVNIKTGEVMRLCRLDIPGSRIEGSELQIDEIQYYITNVETKSLNETQIYEEQNGNEKRIYTDRVQSEYSKYPKVRKEMEIRAKYLEPREQVQQELRNLYKLKLKEQYGIE